jgi:hypothetical protein
MLFEFTMSIRISTMTCVLLSSMRFVQLEKGIGIGLMYNRLAFTC